MAGRITHLYSALGLLGQGGAALPYLLLRDTFTDANSVLLSAHTPNFGPTWAFLSGEIDIQSNQATGKTLVSSQAVAAANVLKTNIYLTCSVAIKSGADAGLAVRVQDASNYWMVRYTAAATNLEIFEVNSGTFTSRASISTGSLGADGTFYTLEVATFGDLITARIGSTFTHYASTSYNTATKHGLRARAVTTSKFDNLDIFEQVGQYDLIGMFKLTDYTNTALATARASLVNLIWRTELALPSAGVGSTQTGVADPLSVSAGNLASVDKFTTDVGDATSRINYVWHPTSPNGKLLIYHYGHTSEDWNAGGLQVDFINAAIADGYTVCGSQMPPGSTTGHNLYPVPNGSLNAIKYFLEDVIRCINQLAGSYSAIYMCGLSGGAWTTVLCAALDTRITRSVHFAGDFPLFITESSRDYEQLLPGIYPTFDYTDLYVMASSNGRRQIQSGIVNGSSLFTQANYNVTPYADAVSYRVPSGGSYSLTWDNSTAAHEISAAARVAALAFFDAA